MTYLPLDPIAAPPTDKGGDATKEPPPNILEYTIDPFQLRIATDTLCHPRLPEPTDALRSMSSDEHAPTREGADIHTDGGRDLPATLTNTDDGPDKAYCTQTLLRESRHWDRMTPLCKAIVSPTLSADLDGTCTMTA
jgi:hypothetical protein